MQIVALTPEVAGKIVWWRSLSDRERAAWVLAITKAKGATKQDLTDHLGLKYNSVHAWMTGDARCDWARRMAVAHALGEDQTWEPTPAQFTEALREFDALRPPSTPKKKRKRTAH